MASVMRPRGYINENKMWPKKWLISAFLHG
jgi:hypothetical protein